LNLGLLLFILWPHLWLLGWTRFGKVTISWHLKHMK
jgi:hypothetical protein